MIALVLAAGFGTRFRPATLTTPKPLLPFLGRPILHHLFDHLLAHGVEKLVVNAHHLAGTLEAALGDSYRDVPVAVSCEESILGTAGGIRCAFVRGLLGGGPFLVANGDVFTTLPLSRLQQALEDEGDPVVSALGVLPNERPGRGTPLWSDGRGRLVQVGGERPSGALGPWLFTGLQAARPSLVARVPEGFSELARDVLAPSVAARDGAFLLVPYRAPAEGFWFDLGSPEKLARAEQEVRERAAEPHCIPQVLDEGRHS